MKAQRSGERGKGRKTKTDEYWQNRVRNNKRKKNKRKNRTEAGTMAVISSQLQRRKQVWRQRREKGRNGSDRKPEATRNTNSKTVVLSAVHSTAFYKGAKKTMWKEKGLKEDGTVKESIGEFQINAPNPWLKKKSYYFLCSCCADLILWRLLHWQKQICLDKEPMVSLSTIMFISKFLEIDLLYKPDFIGKQPRMISFLRRIAPSSCHRSFVVGKKAIKPQSRLQQT